VSFCCCCLSHPVRDEELEAQVLQSPVKVGCHLLVLLPGLLQPLEGDKDQWRYVRIRPEVRDTAKAKLLQ